MTLRLFPIEYISTVTTNTTLKLRSPTIIIVPPNRPLMKSARFKNKAEDDKALHLIRLVVQSSRV